MRVLILGSYAPSLINFRGPLITALIAAGHEVHVAAPDMSDDIHSALFSLGAHVIETPMERTRLNPFRDLAYLKQLRHLIVTIKPGLVLTYTIKPNIWGALAAKSAGVTSVAMITGLGYAFTDSQNTKSLKSQLIRRIAIWLYRLATNRNWRVIFQNPSDQHDFIAAGCLSDPDKARIVNGSGVDMEHYTPVPLPAAPVFLMVSRLLGNKGVREYGAAAIVMKNEFPQARFLLLGYVDEGPDKVTRDELDAWIEGGVEYLGAQADVRPAIAQSSVCVLPSYREGTPRSVLEAMAMGRSVLTSDAPGCRETVLNGKTGFLVPVQNADALSEKMKWMIDHPEARKTMGAASLALARKKYDVKKVNKSLMQHLELL